MKLYIETTVPNFLHAEDAPEKRNATEAFFDWLKISPDTLYTSDLVFAEIKQTPDAARREKVLSAISELDCEVLPLTVEAQGFANRLVAEGAIPARFRDDAVHAALAVLHGIDVLVTWNMRHLANPRRIEAINLAAMRAGHGPIRIHTPEETMMI